MRLRALATCAVVAVLTACGGGGGGGTSAPAQPSVATTAPTTAPGSGATTASLSLIIPSASSSSAKSRRSTFVSPAIASVAIFAAAGTAPLPPTATTLVNVGPSQPGCTAVSAGTSCTINVPAVYGPMTFLVKTYSGTLGSGSLLSQATFTTTIVVGQTPIPLTLYGTIASVSLSLRTTFLPSGSGTAILDVNAVDPSGATIVGPGNYVSPIAVTSSDSSVTLSANSVTAPNQPITVTVSQPTIVEFTGTVAGLNGNAYTPAILTAGSSYARVFVDFDGIHQVQVFPSIASFAMTPLYSIALNQPLLGIAANASGTLLVAYDAQIQTYPPGAVTPASTLPLIGGQYVDYESLAEDAAGNQYVTTSNNIIYEYPAGATSATGYTRAIGPLGITSPVGIAVDGAGTIYELEGGSTPFVNVWTSGQSGPTAPARTLSLPANGTVVGGIAADAAGDVAVLTYKTGSHNGTIVQFFAPGASTPSRSWTPVAGNADGIAFGSDGTLYAGGTSSVGVLAAGSSGPAYLRSFGPLGSNAGFAEPLAVGGAGIPAAPSTTSVTGDFIAPSSGKTWNYTASGASVASPYSVSIYVDPQPDVSGNLALVGFQSSTPNIDAAATGGTQIGAAGLSQSGGGYTAQSFGSVSNDSYGIIPGGALLVPATLTYGETISLYPGVTGTVTGIGTMPGESACPNPSATGASVAYSVQGFSSVVSYVPGCGITDLVTDRFVDFRLHSITQNSGLGQQSIARRVLSATPLDNLRALWKSAFKPWVKP